MHDCYDQKILTSTVNWLRRVKQCVSYSMACLVLPIQSNRLIMYVYYQYSNVVNSSVINLLTMY